MAGFGADVIASAITTDIGILSAARHMVMKTVQRRPRKHWFADLKAEALACWVRRTSDQSLWRLRHPRGYEIGVAVLDGSRAWVDDRARRALTPTFSWCL